MERQAIHTRIVIEKEVYTELKRRVRKQGVLIGHFIGDAIKEKLEREKQDDNCDSDF